MGLLWYVFVFAFNMRHLPNSRNLVYTNDLYCKHALRGNEGFGWFRHLQPSSAAGSGLGGPIVVVLGTKHSVQIILRLI